MSYQATVYNVMISAPTDCKAECKIAHEVIHAWNAAHAEYERKIFLPVDWEKNTVPEAGTTGQKSINKQIVDKADLLIAIFKHRLGTPTDKAASGTAEEIQEIIGVGKPAFLYFSTGDIPQQQAASEQFAKLQKFRESCKDKDYYGAFKSTATFRNQLKRHFDKKAHDFPGASTLISQGENVIWNEKQIDVVAASQQQKIPMPQLGERAIQLLELIASDQGKIGKHQYISSRFPTFTVGQKKIECNDQRTKVELENALEQLELQNFIKPKNSKRDTFEITTTGYTFIDTLALSKPLSNTAEQLLMSASENGRILYLESIDGLSVQAGELEFMENPESHREKADVDAALKELEQEQYISPANSDRSIFEVTKAGFAYVDAATRAMVK